MSVYIVMQIIMTKTITQRIKLHDPYSSVLIGHIEDTDRITIRKDKKNSSVEASFKFYSFFSFYIQLEGRRKYMEDSISNPLRFETNPYHNVVIKDRKIMELTGVKQIDSFDSSEFLMETAQGWMLVQGKDLTLGKLDTERGDVVIKGLIENLSYVSNKKGSPKESFMSKIFK